MKRTPSQVVTIPDQNRLAAQFAQYLVGLKSRSESFEALKQELDRASLSIRGTLDPRVAILNTLIADGSALATELDSLRETLRQESQLLNEISQDPARNVTSILDTGKRIGDLTLQLENAIRKYGKSIRNGLVNLGQEEANAVSEYFVSWKAEAQVN